MSHPEQQQPKQVPSPIKPSESIPSPVAIERVVVKSFPATPVVIADPKPIQISSPIDSSSSQITPVSSSAPVQTKPIFHPETIPIPIQAKPTIKLEPVLTPGPKPKPIPSPHRSPRQPVPGKFILEYLIGRLKWTLFHFCFFKTQY